MIPLATTTVTIVRVGLADGVSDPADNTEPVSTTIAEGVRATIGAPSASVALSSGTRVVYTARMVADLVDLEPEDLVQAADGTQWTCLWAKQFGTFGLLHTEAQLKLVEGAN